MDILTKFLQNAGLIKETKKIICIKPKEVKRKDKHYTGSLSDNPVLQKLLQQNI